MDKRQFLKVTPMAVMGAVALKVGSTEAKGYEINPTKRYIIVLPSSTNISQEQLEEASTIMHQRGINAVVMTNVDGLQIYEIDT